MTEYHEMQKEAAEARIGAARMAMGLPCIPHPVRGDMAEIERLTGLLAEWENHAGPYKDAEIERLRSESVLLRREIDLIRSLVYQHEDTATLKDTSP